MFVRIKSSKNSPKRSVQIVESIRQDNKIKQHIVRHVGTALNDAELEELKRLAEHIKEKMLSDTQPSLFTPEHLAEVVIKANETVDKEAPIDVNLRNIREEQRIITGIHEIFGAVYSDVGFDNIIPVRKPAALKDLKHTVMARIANPGSKRQNVSDLVSKFGIEISLSSVYRMMDAIDDNVIKKINKCACDTAKSLLQQNVNVAFYDCTTLYFESFEEDEDLLKNGYSKDMKFNQPQLLLALLTTTDGLPLGYELYPGNTFEGTTLTDAVNRLREEYSINKIIFVADSGLLSNDNLSLLEEKGIEYIVGARLKKSSGKQQKEILSESGWVEMSSSSNEDKETYKELSFEEGRRMVISYRSSRAKKDKADRDKTVQKLIKRIGKSKDPTSLISNFGYKKFITVTGDAQLEINSEKLAEAQKWDGIHGIISNVKDLSATDILAQYRSLWEIEECFRISKHDLKFRPVFHWTKNRIKAHIAICFMSLLCVRYLQYHLKVQGHRYSVSAIVRELNSIQVSVVRDIKTKNRYAIPSSVSEMAHTIYKHFGRNCNQIPHTLP